MTFDAQLEEPAWTSMQAFVEVLASRFQQEGSEESKSIRTVKAGVELSHTTWTSQKFRLAQVDVVDASKTKNMWGLLCCVYPHFDDSAPILGIDFVAGRKVITGFFHDFSPSGDPANPLLEWFKQQVESLLWSKTRAIPPWGQSIFSDSIIMASGVKAQKELDQITKTVELTFPAYMQYVGTNRNGDHDGRASQNHYMHNQKLNPHTRRMLLGLGMAEQEVTEYTENMLFVETPS